MRSRGADGGARDDAREAAGGRLARTHRHGVQLTHDAASLVRCGGGEGRDPADAATR